MLTKIEWFSANGVDITTLYQDLNKVRGFDTINTKSADGKQIYEIYLYLEGYNCAISMKEEDRDALVQRLINGK